MKTEKLERWISLTANLAVLVGIIFLALEIQQSNRIASVSMELGIRQNFISIQEYILVNDDVAGLLAKARDPDAKFSPTEDEKIWAFIYAHLNQWISVELSYRQGLASEFTFQQVREDIASVLPYTPSMSPYWREAVSEFGSLESLEITGVIQQELEKLDAQDAR